MKKILLSNTNKYALVDNEDYEFLSQFNWWKNGSGYAVRDIRVKGKLKRIWMHREIMKTPPSKETDHINGDTLDNRRSNLRICSHRQNGFNTKPRKNGTSIYKGVHWDKKAGLWCARVVSKNKKQVFLGNFKEERHAAMAYDIWARDSYGPYAQMNFKSLQSA